MVHLISYDRPLAVKFRIEVVVVHYPVDLTAYSDRILDKMPRPARITFPVPCLADTIHGVRQGVGMPVQVSLSERAAVTAVLQGAPEHSLELAGARVAVRNDAGNSFAAFSCLARPRQSQSSGRQQTRDEWES